MAAENAALSLEERSGIHVLSEGNKPAKNYSAKQKSFSHLGDVYNENMQI